MNRRLFKSLLFAFTLTLAAEARGDGVPFNIGDIFAGQSGGTILHYTSNFTLLDTLNTTFAGEQTGMAFDRSMNLYATNFQNSVITRFSPDGNIIMPNPFVMNDPGSHNESIAFTMAGELFIGQADGTRDIIKLAADGTFIARYDVATDGRGSDWTELASDQHTLFYTSESNTVFRFDTATGTQLPALTTALPGTTAFALRFLPTGDLLVADGDRVVRLDSTTGAVLQTYTPTGAVQIFALNIEPGGTTFLTADISTGKIYRFDIATGAELLVFQAPQSVPGLAVLGEFTTGGGGGGMMSNVLDVALPQREILLNITRVATRDVNGRLFRLRANELETTMRTMAASDGKAMVSDGKGVFSGKDERQAAVASEQPFRRLSFFASGDFGNADQDNHRSADTTPDRNDLVGFNGDTFVGTVGAEYRVTRHLTLGLGVGYLNNDTDLDGGLARLNIEGFAITPYVSWTNSHFYVDALYSYGCYNDEIHRDTLADTTVTGDPDSINHTFALNVGYNFHCGQFITGPLASLEYITGELDGYTESGTNGIVFGKQDYESLVSKLGWQGSYRIRTGFGAIVPQLRASWNRENIDDDGRVIAHFTGFDMAARAGRPGDDYLAVGGGVMFEVRDSCAFIVDAEKHLAREDRDDIFVSVRAKVTF